MSLFEHRVMCLNIHPAKAAVLVVTFWQDGFQIEDGELLDYDSPILADFQAGCVYLLGFRYLVSDTRDYTQSCSRITPIQGRTAC